MSSITQTNPYGIVTTQDEWTLAVSLPDFQKTLVDNVYNANVVLSEMKKRKKLIDGGNSIVEILLKEEQNDGGFYSGADTLNTVQGNYVAQCEYKWQNAYEPIQVTRDEERQNSGVSHKIIDLVASKMASAEKAIAKRLEQAVSTPVASAGNTVDLETMVNTGTLGSIAGATYTFWQSTVTTSGAFATQGLSDMTTGTYAVAGSSDVDLPTLYLTNKTIFQKYENTRLPLERITNGDLSANAGFKTLTFKGIPIKYGNYIGSGLLFGLNTDYINWNVDSATDFSMTDWMKPVNQTAKVAYILVRYNMTTNNRRRHFKLTSIS